MAKRNILLTGILLICNMVFSQMPHLYTMRQGLQSSYIESLYVDSANFVWVSTSNSLEVFDGYRFEDVSFTDNQNDTILFKKVNAVRQIDKQHYWFLTNVGLFIYDLSNDRYEKIPVSEQEDDPSNKGSLTHSVTYPFGNKTLFTSEGFGMFIIDNGSKKPDSALAGKLNSLVGESYIWSILIDSKNRLWVSDLRNEISIIDLKSLKKQKVEIDGPARAIMADSYVTSFVESRSHNKIYMAMSHKGVLVYDRESNTIRELCGNDRSLYSNCLTQTPSGDIFLGTDNAGIYQIDLADESLRSINQLIDDTDMRHAKIHSLAVDRDDNLLIGIYQKGLLVMSRPNGSFQYNALSLTENGKNSSCVTSFCRDGKGNLWVGTDGSGLFVNGKNHTDGLASLLIQTIVADSEGTIWCGSWRGGLCCSHNGERFRTPDFLSAYKNSNVMDLAYDRKNHILYAGTNGDGVLRIDLKAQTVNKINGSDVYRWVNKLYLDENGVLWIGDAINLFEYNPLTDKYTLIKLNDKDINLIHGFAENGSHLLLGTDDGLICYDRHAKKVVTPSYLSALSSDMPVKNIVMEGQHIWLCTNRNIICIDKQTGEEKEFDSFNGFYIGEFHRNASLLTADGKMLLGGDNGYLSFSPKRLLSLDKNIKQVYFSPIWLGNKLDGHNSYRISFSVPELTMQERVCYRYMLEGYERKWHVTDSSTPEAYYASLPSGSYTFHVQAYFRDNPDHYTEQTLAVHVPYPWYATWWAYLLYAAALWYVGYIIYHGVKERRLSRMMLREAEENERIKEDKLRLFTSIAHELRSPLTMIMSPLRQLTTSDRNLERQGNYSIMQRNCNRLLRIVNQMLDVRKIDNGQFTLHFSETELNTYTKEVMESFKGVAAAKALYFTHESNEDYIPIWIDTIHFEKVLFNLLSNAFKFTPSSGRVIVRTSCHLNTPDSQNRRVIDDYRVIEYAEIRVYNSGSHLNPEDLNHLWERFYQSSSQSGREGSGIGLNLAYELVKLHHGVIDAHNIGEDGVEFVVRIPMGSVHLSDAETAPREEAHEQSTVLGLAEVADEAQSERVSVDDIPEGSTEEAAPEGEPEAATAEPQPSEIETPDKDQSTDNEKGNEQTSILIVDDDKELCQYVASEIGKEYKVQTAHSGNSAWQLILTSRPTIVVTDLMMPDGDGYDLCRRIKANPETDHIAVIMLTSESSEDNQLRSMTLQADHFLPKPFNLPLLRSAIAQVLRIRENIRNKMRRTEIGNSYGSIEVSSYEDQFIQRVRDLVLTHIDDSNFNVNELSREIGMSRVHLNRKLKEHFGISPIAYIRSVRLKQAAYLLVNNKVNISEVAYRVGFSSHSYFTSIFHDFFGMSPKEFVATYADNLNDETLHKLLE